MGAGTIARETGLARRTLAEWRQQQSDLLVCQHHDKSPKPVVYAVDRPLDQVSKAMTPLSLTVGRFAITITAKEAY